MYTFQLGAYSLSLSLGQIIIASIFTFALLVQLFYLFFFYLRIFFLHKKTNTKGELPPVSVVICARNEKSNLEQFLPEVLEQDYPNFEVIVVDDCSTDGTATLLTILKEDYPNLYYTTINSDRNFSHSKKLALSVGLKAAKNEIVVLTDADCVPASRLWLREMSEQFDDNTDFMLGYGAYEQQSSLLNYFIRFDTATIGMRYLCYAKAGTPYMGVGRNMAYKKKIFFENKGFGKYNHMKSGDDDLLVNKLARKNNTKIALSGKCITRSIPKASWKEWRLQKRRHLTTAPLYRFVHKFLLLLEDLSKVLFYASFIAALIFFPNFAYYFLGAFALRAILQLLIYSKGFRVLEEKYLIWGVLFLDILLPFIYIWLAWPQKKHLRKQSTWM